jgi:hypothetical protein
LNCGAASGRVHAHFQIKKKNLFCTITLLRSECGGKQVRQGALGMRVIAALCTAEDSAVAGAAARVAVEAAENVGSSCSLQAGVNGPWKRGG